MVPLHTPKRPAAGVYLVDDVEHPVVAAHTKVDQVDEDDSQQLIVRLDRQLAALKPGAVIVCAQGHGLFAMCLVVLGSSRRDLVMREREAGLGLWS